MNARERPTPDTQCRHSTSAEADLSGHEPVSAPQVLGGRPTTATRELGEICGLEFGLWEMTPGSATDVEAEELFVVIRGSGTVWIHEHNGFAAHEIHLMPGVVCHLEEGMHTSWSVLEPLRKVYVTRGEP